MCVVGGRGDWKGGGVRGCSLGSSCVPRRNERSVENVGWPKKVGGCWTASCFYRRPLVFVGTIGRKGIAGTAQVGRTVCVFRVVLVFKTSRS